ncbi:hypothetical protein Btru_028951 [Bulinus truncatus]|nr:hypothetical protein Btru_028951 [Bulinus truncatus]
MKFNGADSKLLCSFSGKLCNQRRLNGYGFCIRHILEDPSAPFKRCAYVAKSSNQMCTQAIPKHEERRYCNNHMQVLGMLPKKERKKKDKTSVNPESKTPLVISGTVKPKFGLSNSKDNNFSVISVKTTNSADDPDDPYAFSDTAPTENKLILPGGNNVLSSDSILGKSLQSGQGFVRSPNDISSSSGLMTGGSMIAKYYPELAEKLEKMRAKPEPKLTPKSRARSSRTMNKLQTKIAQNKINEKLRKSQEHGHADPNCSPLQLSSPEQNFSLEHSPSPGSGFSPASSHTYSPQASTSNFTGNLNLSRFDQSMSAQDIPPLPQVDTSFLATLAAQDNLGFQNSGVLEPILTSDRHIASHTPPRLPPPYPGSSTLSIDPPVSAFNQQANLNSVLESLNTNHSSKQSTLTQVGPSGPSSISSLSLNPLQNHHGSLQNTSSSSSTYLMSTSAPSFPSTSTPSYPYSTTLSASDIQLSGLKKSNHMSSSLPPNVDILSLLNMNTKLSIDPVQSIMLPSPNTLAAHLSLPPPPPYVPPAVLQKTNVTVPSKPASNTASAVVTKVSVPYVKLNKLSGVLSEKGAKQKLKSDLAVKFYSFYAKRKNSNHFLIGPNLCSSDEDSEDEDSDMLPWQRDVFSASSSEEADSDELENDVPMGMRPTKISLLKTRLRRQWSQARNAYKTNSLIRKTSNQATLALIRTVRDSAACAVRALWQITHVKKSKRKLLRRLSKTKICCNKSEKEGQCQNLCLPYANHCIKHITYNINQQLFDFCTAKFANNVQCCLPSFDLRHELPLCQEHAAKADNYQKQLELENKKKTRKKSKPPALTRPPRKGKKKKKGRYSRAQKPLPPPVSIGLDSTLSDVDVTSIDTSKPEENLLIESSSSAPVKESSLLSVSQPTFVSQPTLLTNFTAQVKDSNKNMDHALDLADALSPDFDKPFELPLEQASRLLDESDFQEVVNKMPFDELDLFGKNGEPDQDTDHMCIDLNSATKARDALEKLLSGPMSEEESMQLAMVLAQNLSTDAELAHNASLITEAMNSSVAQNDTRLLSGTDISITSHMNETVNIDPSSSVDHQLIGIHSSNISDGAQYGISHSGLHTSYHQSVLSRHSSVAQQPLLTKPSQIGSYGLLDTSKPSLEATQAKLTSSSVMSLPAMEGLPHVLTADLNSVYGQIECLSRSQIAAKKPGLTLQHVTGVDSTTSKTVMLHLPTDSHPTTSSDIYLGHTQGEFITSQILSANSVSNIQSHLNSLDVSRSNVHLDPTVTTQGFNASSLSAINAHSRTLSHHQNFALSSQISSDMSYSLSLPSPAKKMKLDHSGGSQPQQGSANIKNIIQMSATSGSKLTLPENNRTFQQHEIKSPASPKSRQSSSPSSIQRLTLPVVTTGQDNFLSNYSQKSIQPSDNIKLKLPSAVLSESTQHLLAKTEGSGTLQILNSVSSCLSSQSSPLTVNTIRYSLNSDNTTNISSSQSLFTSSTTRRHNLLEDSDNGTTESISVTVRHPSPLESVPTTVRHTLPDTFPTPMTLPTSPALSLPLKSSLPQSSLEQSSLQKLVSSNFTGSQWVSTSPMAANVNLQNGIPFGAGTSHKTQISHRFSPAGQGSVRTKQNNNAAEVARITALANAAGVPVVCSPVSLPGLVQNLSTATFKSSGSS